jgi:hypothetical protein
MFLSNRYLAAIERDTQKHNQQGHIKNLPSPFQNKESRLGIKHWNVGDHDEVGNELILSLFS